MSKGHNGFTNYETWAVALWIDNDQGLQEACREVVKEARDGVQPNRLMPELDMTESHVSACLRAWAEDEDTGMIPDLGATLAADLLNAALSEVDWRDLARHYLAGLVEDEAYEQAKGGDAP